MHTTVIHSGVDSAKISFPPISQGGQPSTRELEEIENAIAQMEFWSAFSSVSALDRGMTSANKDREVEPKKICMVELKEGGPKVEVPAVVGTAEVRDYVHVYTQDMAEGRFTDPSLTAVEPVEEHPVVRENSHHEDSCFEHVLLGGMDPYRHFLQQFVGATNRSIEVGGSSSPRRSAHRPLRPLKNEVFPLKPKAPKAAKHATPKKNAHKPSFKVRRKPVPRLSEVLSKPALAAIEPMDALGKAALNCFPALDSGSFAQHCQFDPEELEAPRETRIRGLTFRKMLGMGGQGVVYLAQGLPGGPETKEEAGLMVYAVKVMIKNRYVRYSDILREQKLLKRLRGNWFLLHLEGSFHDRKNFYLITECHPGGDLEGLLRAHGHFSVSAARIYAAELCAAVFFLHQNFILHRDIKPSNIFIKADGHICLGDLGLAVDFLDHTIDEDSCIVNGEPVIRGYAGTTAYMAPEVLNDEYYGFKADWWSVGITCFNLFEGTHPWPCLEYEWLAQNAGAERVQFGVTTDAQVQSFIRELLQRHKDERVAAPELFCHPIFDGLDIVDVYEGRLAPPYTPQPFDTENMPNTLTKRDLVEIGPKYPENRAPMPNYFFYGSNMPNYEPSMDEIDTMSPEEARPYFPFDCSPSLHALLETSFSQIGSAMVNYSGSAFIPPFDKSNSIYGPTIVEELELDRALVGRGVQDCQVVKDSSFRWSMLSVEEGHFEDAIGLKDNQAPAPIGNGAGTLIDQGQNPASTLNPKPKSTSESESETTSTSSSTIAPLQHEEEWPKLRPELVTPIVGQAPALTSPPRQKVIHKVAKVAVIKINSIIGFNTPDDATMLLAPTTAANNNNRSSSTAGTISPSSLGLGSDVEGEGDETDATTVDFGISESPGTDSNQSSGKGPGDASGPASGIGSQGASASEDALYHGPGSSSVLDKLNFDKPLPSLPIELNDNEGNPNGDNGNGNADASVKADTEDKDDINSGESTVGVMSVLETTAYPRAIDERWPNLYELLMGETITLLSKITRIVVEGIKRFWSKACGWRTV